MEHTSKLFLALKYYYARTDTFLGGVAHWHNDPWHNIIIGQNQCLHYEQQSRCSPHPHQPHKYQCTDSQQNILISLLLALLPITKFTYKTPCIHGLLQDQLVHKALNVILSPLKIAMAVDVIMNDLVGSL